MEIEIPTKVYAWIGVAVISNLVLICTIIWSILVLTWKASARFTSIEKDNQATDKKASLAHKRIDRIENKVY